MTLGGSYGCATTWTPPSTSPHSPEKTPPRRASAITSHWPTCSEPGCPGTSMRRFSDCIAALPRPGTQPERHPDHPVQRGTGSKAHRPGLAPDRRECAPGSSQGQVTQRENRCVELAVATAETGLARASVSASRGALGRAAVGRPGRSSACPECRRYPGQRRRAGMPAGRGQRTGQGFRDQCRCSIMCAQFLVLRAPVSGGVAMPAGLGAAPVREGRGWAGVGGRAVVARLSRRWRARRGSRRVCRPWCGP